VGTVNLKQQLASLLKLQIIDTEIFALKAEKEAKPQEIKVLTDAFEEKKQCLADIEKKSLDIQKQKKDKELELGTKDEAAKKLQTQLFSLKTNKEYQAMLQQIKDAKADASVIEDAILECLDQIDKVKIELEEAKKKVAEEEKAYNQEKKKVDDRVRVIDTRLSELNAQRSQVLPEIEEKILAQYERILNNRDGLAIVSVKDNTCLGCNMFVPPQVINLIRMYERMITCEVCNRILYIDDETS
jgi:predicted  nucleic acid-binding Zn-ribbon protein